MKILASLIILLGLVIGIVPHFTDCQSQGRAIELANGKTVAMKCHWTGEAEIALAVPLVALGGISTIMRRKETKRALAVLGMFLGAFVIALPTVLIGVCANPDMLCNMIMRPTLILSGLIVIAVCAFFFYQAGQEPEPVA
jgi:hypothetical protein